MFKFIQNTVRSALTHRNIIPIAPDPVKHCKVYKEFGCAHVDGPLCNVNTCTIEMYTSRTVSPLGVKVRTYVRSKKPKDNQPDNKVTKPGEPNADEHRRTPT